jgi:hypothetical protein
MLPALLDFFGNTRVDWGMSKKVCKGCPVRKECAAYALQARLVHGVWGGLDPLELRFALGRDAHGEVWAYDRQDVKCVYCRGRTDSIGPEDDKGGGHVTRTCRFCGFSWRRYEPKRARRVGRPTRAESELKLVTDGGATD